MCQISKACSKLLGDCIIVQKTDIRQAHSQHETAFQGACVLFFLDDDSRAMLSGESGFGEELPELINTYHAFAFSQESSLPQKQKAGSEFSLQQFSCGLRHVYFGFVFLHRLLPSGTCQASLKAPSF